MNSRSAGNSRRPYCTLSKGISHAKPKQEEENSKNFQAKSPEF